ncbi:NADH-quinone oxidoreductase subunit K [Streptomyces litchfieldiae]|uniref:NADH-quinone oxidoreductase subunit K n=1 Tax=Streptomyces litchfieldiae TaxID=3075543 RepID=A0ABU2MNT8_9ACTN|nr:NADH-quinone oxidoreductase subunit K [Streptomyces sp. DSM 44938]MDT0342324.1 NADH-quinone oxidoreductase subunit K [Streptomyces sp. DSM 44938]
MRALDLTMALVLGGLFATGVLLMLQRSLTRVLLGFILLGHGTNLLLLTTGGADPLPQAMALTAIVITFGVTTFLLALAYRSWRLSGHDEVRDDVEDRRIGTVRERADDEPALGVEEDAG